MSSPSDVFDFRGIDDDDDDGTDASLLLLRIDDENRGVVKNGLCKL